MSEGDIVPGIPVKISENVRRIVAPNPSIMTGTGTNTYIVGDRPSIVIDPGPEIESHLNVILDASGGNINSVLLTHTHPDHAPLAARLSAVTGAPVVGFSAGDGVALDREIADGGIVSVGELTIRAVHTPGHVYNHHVYLLEQEQLAFSGDHIMEGSTVVIIPPEGDMADYLMSLRKLSGLEPEVLRIAPGHGRIIEDPVSTIKAYLSHRIHREKLIFDAVPPEAEVSVAEVVDVAYEGTPDHLLPVAKYSAWAHLRKLEKEGRVTSNATGALESLWRRV